MAVSRGHLAVEKAVRGAFISLQSESRRFINGVPGRRVIDGNRVLE